MATYVDTDLLEWLAEDCVLYVEKMKPEALLAIRDELRASGQFLGSPQGPLAVGDRLIVVSAMDLAKLIANVSDDQLVSFADMSFLSFTVRAPRYE
jgi:hypothetical protein